MRPKHVAATAVPPFLGHRRSATKVHPAVDVVVDCLLLAIASKELAAPRLRYDDMIRERVEKGGGVCGKCRR